MQRFELGKDFETGRPVYLPRDSFKTHYHLIGGTGKGKTTALHTLLQQMLKDSLNKDCFFIIDKLGNISYELLMWMTSAYCPQHVRDRLVYIQAANEDVVCPLNPFVFQTDGEGYYKCERATEIILRGWESQNIDAMPRLARWLFNAFWAAAQLGLTISDCEHFLRPGSDYHSELLARLPPAQKAEWHDVLKSTRGADVLDSSRNRLRPYFDSNILRRMFGSTTNKLDVLRMMREGRIVLVDLAPYGKVGDHLASTIGSLLINEIIATVRTLPMGVRYPTYLFLDEFQNFVGPDVESALPELRNLGLRMILSHQSLAQLRRGDYDMTNIIFAAQSRMIFGLQGRDAELLAEEIASLRFDPYSIKDQLYSRRQLSNGHKIIELHSWSEAEQQAEQWTETTGRGWSHNRGESETRRDNNRKNGYAWDVVSRGTSDAKGESGNHSEGRGGSRSKTTSQGAHQALLPTYDEFMELMNKTYFSFDEQKQMWAQDIRRLKTGRTFLRLVNDENLYTVDVRESKPGILSFDPEYIRKRMPERFDRLEELKARNFQSEFFVPAAEIDRETKLRMENVLQSRVSAGNIIDLPANSAEEPVI